MHEKFSGFLWVSSAGPQTGSSGPQEFCVSLLRDPMDSRPVETSLPTGTQHKFPNLGTTQVHSLSCQPSGLCLLPQGPGDQENRIAEWEMWAEQWGVGWEGSVAKWCQELKALRSILDHCLTSLTLMRSQRHLLSIFSLPGLAECWHVAECLEVP